MYTSLQYGLELLMRKLQGSPPLNQHERATLSQKVCVIKLINRI